jgi:hypothetical protein
MAMPKKTKKKDEGAIAVHAKSKDGSRELVGIGNLRVMILNDDGSWFAQGLEIDYAAQGTSIADVKARFEKGLAATVSEHLRAFGSIRNILQAAPSDMWVHLAERACRKERYSQLTVHEATLVSEELPFEGISYIQAAA